MSLVDENKLTELEIAPDGRIYLFGASAEILQILSRLFTENDSLRQRDEQIQRQIATCAIVEPLTGAIEEDSHE